VAIVGLPGGGLWPATAGGAPPVLWTWTHVAITGSSQADGQQSSTPPMGAGTSAGSGSWGWAEWNVSISVACGLEWRTVKEVDDGCMDIGRSSAPSHGASTRC
jgi:hypothetical protein